MKDTNELEKAINKMINEEYIADQDFTWFTSEVGHRLKSRGDIKFVSNILDDKDIDIVALPKRQQLYLVGMLDYLCNLNGIPLLEQLEVYRAEKMEELTFPEGVKIFANYTRCDHGVINAYNKAIEEFLQHNIIEYDIRNVV